MEQISKRKWDQESILKLSGQYWAAFALHAAIELDIFTLLDEEGMTIDEIATELSLSKRGTKALVCALHALGFLEKEGEIYFDSREAVEYLSKNSPEYLGYMIKHHHYLSKYWINLPEAIKTGKPVRKRIQKRSDKELEAFLMGMFNNASLIAPKVADLINLKEAKRLLDLGGGPGTYSIHFCLKYPNLKATIYDLPQTKKFAEKMILNYGLTERIEFKSFDYTKSSILEKFDVVWISHILHSEGEKVVQKIIKKSVKALNKNGQIYIHDFFLNEDGSSPLYPALFSLNMLIGTKEGKSYTIKEIQEILNKNGFVSIELINFEGPSQSRIIKGIKP